MSAPVAYRLQPVHAIAEGHIATAAVMTCMATGRILSGMGGGGEFLSPDVVEELRKRDRARIVCDASLFEALVDLARRAARGEDVAADAAIIVADPDLGPA